MIDNQPLWIYITPNISNFTPEKFNPSTMHKKAENLPQQGLLFIVPTLVKPPGPGPSLRALDALGILQRGRTIVQRQDGGAYGVGLEVDEFGSRFYWKKRMEGPAIAYSIAGLPANINKKGVGVARQRTQPVLSHN